MDTSRSHALCARARERMPGGVNSPVRAFRSVGGEPFFAQRAEGPFLFVVDGKVYLGDEDGDIVILAHAKEKKVLAEINMSNPVYATVVPANGALLVNNRSRVCSIAAK